MAIYSSSLKFLASERMTDNTDGGGRITANEVLDGVENNVFTDIASGDRVTGRVYLRKIFAAVRTNDDDAYLAPRVFIAEPPSDPNVSVALFSTQDWEDERLALQAYIERYISVGPITELVLYGNHYTGQGTVQCYQRIGATWPQIGDVIVLSEEPYENEVDAQQFLRITKVEDEVVTWNHSSIGEYKKQKFLLHVSDTLKRDFEGGGQNPSTDYQASLPVKIRETIAVNNPPFKGISPLTLAGAVGDLSAQIESVYTPVIPTTQSDTPVLDRLAGGEITVTVSGGTRSVEFPLFAHSSRILIAIANRLLTYTWLLYPKPSPGSIALSFRALGKWYTVRDDGAGRLTGNAVGSVDYATGSATVTLAAIPDINSSLIWQWGTTVHFRQVAMNEIKIRTPQWSVNLKNTPIVPGSIRAEWTTGGVVKQALDFFEPKTPSGYFAGDAAGHIHYASGRLLLKPLLLPDPNSALQVTYRYGNRKSKLFFPEVSGGYVTINLSGESGGDGAENDSAYAEDVTRVATALSRGSIDISFNVKRLFLDSDHAAN
jgi:hypothetical protein